MSKVLQGKVVSIAGDKTVGVEVERVYVHPLYEKRLKRRRKFLTHDILGAKVGDMVEIVQSRPISKMKKWKVTKIVQHAST